MKPNLYLICGLPGSGKTKFSEKLSSETGAIVYSSDEWILKKYGREFSEKKFKEYQSCIRNEIALEAEKNLKKGKNVILDYGFWTKQSREEYRKKGKKWNANVITFFLNTPYKTLLSRLSKRNKNLPDDTLEVTEDMLKNFSENFESPKNEPGVKVINVN